MSFQSTVLSDNKKVFLQEFTDVVTIKYNGITYSNVHIAVQDNSEGHLKSLSTFASRKVKNSDKIAEIYQITSTVYLALEDLNGIIPEQMKKIQISEGTNFYHTYYVATSRCEMGMIKLGLEDFDE